MFLLAKANTIWLWNQQPHDPQPSHVRNGRTFQKQHPLISLDGQCHVSNEKMYDCDSCFSTQLIVTTTPDHCTWALSCTRSATEGPVVWAVWLQRGGHLPSGTWLERRSPLMMLFLGWPTSQLTRRCFISFPGINVCLCISSKAKIYGSSCRATAAGSDHIHRSIGRTMNWQDGDTVLWQTWNML